MADMRSFPKKRIKTLRGTRKHKDTQQHEPEERKYINEMFHKKGILIGKQKLRKRHALPFLLFAFCKPHFALCLTIDSTAVKYSLNII